MKIVWTKLAVQDLWHVRNYIEENNPKAADAALQKIAKAVENLSFFPNLGRPGRVKGTRELIVLGTPFIAAYRLKKVQLEILAVIHGTRRWPDNF